MSEVIQLSLWDYLDTASKTPVDADLFGLLDRVEESIEFLPTSEKLAVAGEAILRLGEIYGDRCAVTLAEIGYLSHPEREPCLSLDAFDCYVRQSSFVDLEQFIEAPELPEVERGYERSSVVRELSVSEALTQIEDEVATQTIDLQTAYQQAIGLAHDENVAEWGVAILARLDEWDRPVSLLELQESIEMPLVQVWLALLLNGMTLEQRGDFYQTEQVWILR
ncbi:hypothetical protein [Chamaesiphon minutus]|uniref:Uncharacterized protein n=1 Tax=Chamaesiphon minutus (strain ATCC 27169 / PCC 6605) TaxID=1173020 RepID=K9UQJ6_CHAP6|nr:hypothetical protein [Chamaesiphon minutus]AFY97075.1 hypothetical protein Cha6605_6249 [Chamaesiphon minutus PCC 6605]